MLERAPLDVSSLVAQTGWLRLLLAVSTAVGMVIGLTVIFFVAAIGLGFASAGLGAIAALVAFGVGFTRIVLAAAVAVVVIPFAAAFATHLKMGHLEDYILKDSGAQPADPNSQLGHVIATMSHSAGLPEPPRYGVVSEVFNAFAMSSQRSAGLVLVGETLINKLPAAQLLAIVGHEIGHIAMDDGRRKYLAIAHQEFLFSFLVFSGLKRWARRIFGFIGEAALAAHSREREYWADAVGAYVTNPEAMIEALQSLEHSKSPKPVEKQYAALMFRPVNRLFSTHPSTAKRIQALQERRYLDRLPLRPVEAPATDAANSLSSANYAGI
jgi:heat shock protein HtpX